MQQWIGFHLTHVTLQCAARESNGDEREALGTSEKEMKRARQG